MRKNGSKKNATPSMVTKEHQSMGMMDPGTEPLDWYEEEPIVLVTAYPRDRLGLSIRKED